MKIIKVGSLIRSIRGQRVMLDVDLAVLYGVKTKYLNQMVQRNLLRFPSDFMFRLTGEELENLRLQIATSSWGGRRYPPRAFTEQGVAMLSGVLNSVRAIRVNIEIMRTFIRLRSALQGSAELTERMHELEQTQVAQEKELGEHAVQIHEVFAAIRDMAIPRRSE